MELASVKGQSFSLLKIQQMKASNFYVLFFIKIIRINSFLKDKQTIGITVKEKNKLILIFWLEINGVIRLKSLKKIFLVSVERVSQHVLISLSLSLFSFWCWKFKFLHQGYSWVAWNETLIFQEIWWGYNTLKDGQAYEGHICFRDSNCNLWLGG